MSVASSPFLIKPDIQRPPTTPLPTHPYTFPLDPFQQHAICAIAKDEHVLVCAKTGSGKTLVGEYQIFHSLEKGKRVFYTTPIKSLSNQKFHDLRHLFPHATVGIMTGDLKFCPTAQIVVMTTEILRNLLYKRGTSTESLGLTSNLSLEDVDAVVFDECHYINDRDRGSVWEETMILLPSDVRMVMLSATLDHPEYLAEWLGELKQTPVHLIETHYRIVPLTHYAMTPATAETPAKLTMIMDAKESYKEQDYKGWLLKRQRLGEEERAYQRQVIAAKEQGTKGGIEGKVRGTASYVHQLNTSILYLQSKELLPALFFVLSRKQCERYAAQVEHTLLDQADAAAVKHIIGFHLHRFQEQLQCTPQYHQITDLLLRGIAFHHSGLLPLLKEIVEILFSKGYVKVLFCTETFAVGLNMPTKTVVFSGLKKYDDEMGGMRLLRNDEYMQMAGRAGRRGKDDKGVVIYLPAEDPIQPHEMFQIVKGERPPITSRMTFHYDFVLKTMQSSPADTPLKWLQILQKSYWYRQNQSEQIAYEAKVADAERSLQEIEITDPQVKKGCEDRARLEHVFKHSVNATKKSAQRELDRLKNQQVGPRWAQAWQHYQEYAVRQHKKMELMRIVEGLRVSSMHRMDPIIRVLYRWGYIQLPTSSLCDGLTREHLTTKGVLATEINEGHPILLTEMYHREYLHTMEGNDILVFLAAFLEAREEECAPGIEHIMVSSAVKEAWNHLQHIVEHCMDVEIVEQASTETEYWNTTTYWMEAVHRWIRGESSIAELCKMYGAFEGNMLRSFAKLSNMVDELLSIATYCQHVEQVKKLSDLKARILEHGLFTSESLYLHL